LYTLSHSLSFSRLSYVAYREAYPKKGGA
jgi:hypothetical protein